MADQKLADLTEDTAPGTDSLVYTVDDPAGTPVDRKVTVGNLALAMPFRGARAYRGTAQTIANNSNTAVNLTAESFDTNSLHDNVTDNTRVKLDKVGYWLVLGRVGYSSNGTGSRQARIHKNGTVVEATNAPAVSGTAMRLTAMGIVNATAITDYVEIVAFQTSGGNLDLEAGGEAEGTMLTVAFLGP